MILTFKMYEMLNFRLIIHFDLKIKMLLKQKKIQKFKIKIYEFYGEGYANVRTCQKWFV